MERWTLAESLTRADNGQDLAAAIIAAIRADTHLELDFASVEVITPSFANSLVMTLLAEFPPNVIREKCAMLNRKPCVLEAINSAAARFNRGIRLSNQMPVFA